MCTTNTARLYHNKCKRCGELFWSSVGNADLCLECVSTVNAPKWEHLWDAPDGTFKGRCNTCGFVHYFIEGHDTQYHYCPQCGVKK